MKRGGWIQRLFGVQPGEGQRVLLMFLYNVAAVGGVVITGQLVSRSLFLSALPKSAIPLKFILPPLVMVMVATLYARISPRLRNDKLILWTCGLMAAGIVLFRLGLAAPFGNKLPYLCAVFVFFDVMSNLSMIQVWTFAGELFNPREAKRVFGLIAGGGTIAAILFGGALTSLSSAVDPRDLLYLMVISQLICMVCVAWLGRRNTHLLAEPEPAKKRGESKGSIRADFREVMAAPLLVSLSLLLVVVTLVCCITDYQLDLGLQAAYANDSAGMLGFLGTIRFWTGLLAALIQFFFAARILEKFGIKGALLLLPVGVGLGSLAIIGSGGLLWAVLLPRGTDMVLKYTINDTSFNLLYLPIKVGLRRKAKLLLDGMIKPTVVSLLGVVFLLLDRFSTLGVVAWSIPVLVLIGFWIRTLLRACGQYVDALAESIRQRRFDPARERLNLSDSTTLTVLRRALVGSDSLQALHALSLLPQIPEGDWEEELAKLLDHEDPEVRLQTVRTVGALQAALPKQILSLTEDLDRKVAREAVRVYCRLLGPECLEQVIPFLAPGHPLQAPVLEGILSYAGDEGAKAGSPILEELANGARAEQRLRATKVLARLSNTPFTVRLLKALLQDSDPEVEMAALRACGSVGSVEFVAPLLVHLEKPRFRGLAARSLGRCLGADLSPLASSLANLSTPEPIRIALTKSLEVAAGRESLQLLWNQLSYSRGRYRSSVCRALLKSRQQGFELPLDGDELTRILEREVRETYRLTTMIAAQEEVGSLLHQAQQRRLREAFHRTLSIAALSHPQLPLQSLQQTLTSEDAGKRANAIELLDNTLDETTKPLLLPLFGEDLETLAKFAESNYGDKLLSPTCLLADQAQGEDLWLSLCALQAIADLALSDCVEAVRTAAQSEHPLVLETAERALRKLDPVKGQTPMPLSTLEKVMFLRSVPLFERIEGEELLGIAPIAKEVRFEKGRRFITRGEDGDCLYVLVSGAVEVSVDGKKVGSKARRETLGELAVLSERPRSADCVALEDVVALQIDKADFASLMEERPLVANGVIQVLLSYLSANSR